MGLHALARALARRKRPMKSGSQRAVGSKARRARRPRVTLILVTIDLLEKPKPGLPVKLLRRRRRIGTQ